MENLTRLISAEIKKQYRSVRQFAIHMRIPQTTIFSILKNGIGGTAYETVVKICSELGIGLINYTTAIKIDNDILKMIRHYNFLDEVGAHTVNAVLNAEYERCKLGPQFVIRENLTDSNYNEMNNNTNDFKLLNDD